MNIVLNRLENGDLSGPPPQSRAPQSRAPQFQELQFQKADIALPLANLRVLVIDDDVDVRELVSFILVREGAIATIADSAQSAFEALGSFRPQLLVSDIGMPGEDGYSLIRRVRTLHAKDGGAVPAIALSALQSAEDRSRALNAGFDIHLGKPVFPAVLVHAAVSLAGRCAPQM